MSQEHFGFDRIYTHNRQTWIGFWKPVCSATLTMMIHMLAITLPIITTALPGLQEISRKNLRL